MTQLSQKAKPVKRWAFCATQARGLDAYFSRTHIHGIWLRIFCELDTPYQNPVPETIRHCQFCAFRTFCPSRIFKTTTDDDSQRPSSTVSTTSAPQQLSKKKGNLQQQQRLLRSVPIMASSQDDRISPRPAVELGSSGWIGADCYEADDEWNMLTRKFFDTVKWDALASIASSLRAGVRCSYEDKFSIGQFNLVRRLNFDDGVSWVVRVRLPPEASPARKL